MRIKFLNSSVEITGERSLLTEMEDKGLSLKNSCRQGHCGLCKCKLKKGSVRHADTLVDLKPGEILACSATATSDIEIVAT